MSSKKQIKVNTSKKPVAGAAVSKAKNTSTNKDVNNVNNKLSSTNNAPQLQQQQQQQQQKLATEEIKVEISEEEKKKHASAIKIQCAWRKYNAITLFKKLKIEKDEMEKKILSLEQEAYVKFAKMEQEKEEKKRMKKLKEKQLKQKQEQRRKKFLEAAYEGNLQEIKFLINDLENEINSIQRENGDFSNNENAKLKKKKELLKLIDCKDPNQNSALSEAAVGGSVDVIRFLLSNQANPNSVGAFGRTPLWRAAFSGNLECVQILLENGADPRLYSTDGQRPSDAATKEEIQNLLKNWNMDLTNRMLKQIERSRNEQKQEFMQDLDERRRAAYIELKNIRTEYNYTKNELYKCNCELNRLHEEYLLNEKMYGQLIDEKESLKVDLQIKFENIKEKCVKASISYRELVHELKKEKKNIKTDDSNTNNNDDDDDDEEADEDGEDLSGDITQINIKELDDIILRDLGDKLKNSYDKWPLIMDQNDQAATYLRYRDTNYVNCLDMEAMKSNKFRLALLGSIRYGKPFVLDLLDYDVELLNAIKAVCEQVDNKLYEQLINKELIRNESFLRLVRPEDGKEYELQNFNELRIKNFKVIFLTSNPYPSDSILNITQPFKIGLLNKQRDDDF